MSMSGWARWKASMRGSSQSDAKDAKVVTLTRARALRPRICRTATSMRASAGSTTRSRLAPSDVSST